MASVTGDSLTVSGNPGWTADQFGPQDELYQYIALLRKSTGTGANHEGDWWFVQENTANTLVLQNRSENLTGIVQAGDHVEVRRLTSIKDLFGTGTTVLLNKDFNGFASPAEEDLIRFITGTGFSTDIFYHDGSLAAAGYYANGEGPFEGSTLTLLPDQAFMFYRKPGSANLHVRVLGQVQVTRLTHYFQPGANPVGTGFADPAPLETCGLRESAWVTDSNGFGSSIEEDLVRTVTGTGFDKEIFYHNGALAAPGWYVNGEENNSFPFEPGRGYFVFIKGPGPSAWRQAVPSPSLSQNNSTP